MLDLLSKLISPRALSSLALALAFCFAAFQLRSYPPALMSRLTSPAQTAPAPEGRELLGEGERARARQLEGRYRDVLALIDAAQKQGFPVAGLKEKADVAFSLGAGAYRGAALRMLSEVELAVPRKKETYIPAYPWDEKADVGPAPKAVRAKSKRPR
jgi:hypothetical protein